MIVAMPIEKRLGVEMLAVIIINFDSDGIDEFDEMVNVLYSRGSYYYALKILDLDLKNRSTPSAHPSIEKPLVLA